MTSIQIPFDNDLGARNKQSKITARESLASFQNADAAFQSLIASSIVGKEPSQTTIDTGLAQATAVLASGQTALKDAYTVLADSTTSGNLTDAQLSSYKSQIADLGSQTQRALNQIHDINAGVAALKKESASQIAVAQAQLTQMQGQALVNQTILADGSIHAPFAGVITQKYVETGAVVAPGTPIVHLADDSQVKIVVGVPEELARTISVGKTALVTPDSGSGAVTARVSTIRPAIDPVSRKISIEFLMDNSSHTIKSGSYAHVVFAQQGATSLAVPRSAVVSRYEASFVYILDGTKVRRNAVTTGAISDSLIEITSGLAEGDVVVTAGNDYLRDGDTVATSSTSSR